MLIPRILLAAIWFFGSCFVLLCIALFRPFSVKNTDLYSRFICPVALFILGIDVKARNVPQLKKSQPCVFIVNHQSIGDVFILGKAIPTGTVSIGKKSLRWIPIFGWLFSLAGNLLIDRKDSAKAMATMEKAREKLTDQGVSFAMTPEGTRSRGRPMGPFKKGAFYLAVDAKVPIQPVVVSSFYPVNLWRWRSATVLIEGLEPLSTVGKTHEDIDELITVARERMRLAIERLDKELRG